MEIYTHTPDCRVQGCRLVEKGCGMAGGTVSAKGVQRCSGIGSAVQMPGGQSADRGGIWSGCSHYSYATQSCSLAMSVAETAPVAQTRAFS